MKTITLSLLTAILLIINSYCFGQTDSSYIDMGRLKVKNAFTQTIDIKGSDLEQMPFSSLEEAINVYLYGTYSTKATLTYVIDGMLINDVNAYSIYDIEKITLIQNALGKISGANDAGWIVVITTRANNNRAKGTTLAANSFIVNRRLQSSAKNTELMSSPDFFHQYYISSNHQKATINFGASVNFLRDILPIIKDSNNNTSSSPYQLSRFRLNAWLNTSIGKKSMLSIKVNAAPQQRSMRIAAPIINAIPVNSKTDRDYKGKELIFYPSINFTTKISGKLFNEFNAGFLSGRYKENGVIVTESTFFPPTTNVFQTKGELDIKERIIKARDDIRYTENVGHWQFEPALNVSYTYININEEQNRVTEDPSSMMPVSIDNNRWGAKGHLFLATPSMGIYFKNFFALQGGVQFNTNLFDIFTSQSQKSFPFVTTSIDVLQIWKNERKASIKLFGSYAENSVWGGEEAFGLRGSKSGFTSFTGSPSPLAVTGIQSGNNDKSVVQAGLQSNLLNNKLQIGYNYEKNSTEAEMYIITPGGFVIIPTKLTSTIHRVSVGGKMTKAGFSWQTGAFIASIYSKLKSDFIQPIPSDDPEREWRGGWFNYFHFGSITAGFKALYCLNQTLEVYQNVGPITIPVLIFMNSDNFLLQQIYVGYKWQSSQLGSWEIFASGRNLIQSKNFELSVGECKYYGLGIRGAF